MTKAGAPDGDGRWGVRIRNVHFERPGDDESQRFRLDIPDFHIGAGPDQPNRIPIMGISGAGKSTLMNLLAAVVWPARENAEAKVAWRFPDGFTCEWDANGPSAATLIKLRRKYFGYAFQSVSLQPHLTIAENLCYPLEISGTPHAEAMKIAEERLSQVFHGDRDRARSIMRRFDSDVSGGEKQRISLVQSVIHDPYVLFADEPTGSLDQNTRRSVMQVLLDWLDEKPRERLLLWVTHHADDPNENGVNRRVFIADRRCAWQQDVGTGWQDVTVGEAA